MRHTKTKSGEQGAVLVEMALMLPLLALIFLTIIDLGLIVREYQLLQNAAREAARYSAQPVNQISRSGTPDATLADIKQFAVNYAAQEGITIDLTIDPNYVQVDQRVEIPGNCGSRITITYPRQILFLGAPFLPVTSITLNAQSVFYNLYGC